MNRGEPKCETVLTIQQQSSNTDKPCESNNNALENKVLDLQAINLHLKQKVQELQSTTSMTQTNQQTVETDKNCKKERSFELVTTKTNPSYKIYVHGKDFKDYISEQIRHWGKWSECETIVDMIRKTNLIPSKTTIVEVGANLGSCTLLLAKIGHRVIAFEPVEFSAKLLKKSLVENVFDSEVILIEAAASNKKGNSTILSEDQNFGNSFISTKKNSDFNDVIWTGSNLQKQVIRMVKIDDVVREDVHFMKLDCQGFELYALQGAEQTLRKNMPVLYLEFAPFLLRKADVNPLHLLEFLDNLGYTLWRDNMNSVLKPQEFERFSASFKGQEANDLVAIKKDTK